MKRIIIVLMSFCFTQTSNAQSSNSQTNTDTCGYAWEQEELVFRFNPNDYTDINTSYGMWKQLPKVKVKEVFVSSTLNNWATNANDYRMTKEGNEYVLRLRMDKRGSLNRMEFKFVINGKYWVEPKGGCANTADSGAGYGSKNYVFYFR